MKDAESQSSGAFEAVLSHLQESHELSVYDAIERLVHAAEEVGMDGEALVRMLDRGTTFAEVLELIETRMEQKHRAA